MPPWNKSPPGKVATEVAVPVVGVAQVTVPPPLEVAQVAQAMAPAADMVTGEVPLRPAEPTLLIGSWPDTSLASATELEVTV